MNAFEKSVLSKVTNEAASATKISKLCGFRDKSAKVTSALEALVAEGNIVKDTSGQYPTYKLSAVRQLTTGVYESTSKDIVAPVKQEKTKETEEPFVANSQFSFDLPTEDNGYKIEILRNEAEELMGFKVTDPNGKVFNMEPNQRVVVVNKTHRWMISNPEDIFSAIGAYTKEKGIGTYIVREASTNRAITDKDKSDAGKLYRTVIIFVKVEAHNKAGA